MGKLEQRLEMKICTDLSLMYYCEVFIYPFKRLSELGKDHSKTDGYLNLPMPTYFYSKLKVPLLMALATQTCTKKFIILFI